MQIKRFEADDMNEALRLVKREFGQDAVILSAKEVTPSGILKAMRKKRIVVTAAMGTPTGPGSGHSDADPAFTGLLTSALKSEENFSADTPADIPSDTPTDRVSLSARPLVSDAPSSKKADSFSPFSAQVSVNTASPQAAQDLSVQAWQLVSTLRQYRKKETPPDDAARVQEKNTVPAVPLQAVWETPFFRMDRPQHRIAVVGPSGAGKSSMVAKLARYCQAVENKQIALVSLDRYRVGANGLLENTAKILNLSVVRAHGADDLLRTMEKFADVPVVLIDTPGMGGGDHVIQKEIGSLLKIAAPHEVHLVINATIRRRVMADILDRFAALDVNRLMLTHLDEYESRRDAVSDLYPTTQLSTVFCGTGVDLVDGLQFSGIGITPAGQSRFFPADTPVSPSASGGYPEAEEQYLAGRDSKVFHHPTCRFAKWGEGEDVSVFYTMAKAVDAGFSPCRRCCTVSEKRPATPKPSPSSGISRQYAAVF